MADTSNNNIIAEWPRTSHDTLRIGFVEFRGTSRLDLRLWIENGAELMPTRAGISVPVEQLPDLVRAVRLAEQMARQRGLVNDAGQSASND